MADAATAVRKLQSGQPLTDAEKKLLGMSVTPSKATLTQAEIDAKTAAVVAAGGKSTDPANRLPGETASQANARITQGYKDQAKPDLTKEGKAAGATIEFVRTGAGGVGEYKEVFPIGTPIPGERTTTSGNVYDAQGNLISGTGLKTVTGGTKTPAQLEAERLQKIADEALAKSNASQAKLKRLQDIQAKLARGETLTAEEYALIGITPPSSSSSSDTQPGKAWVKNADGKWVKPTMPTETGFSFSWDDEKGWIGFKVGGSKTIKSTTYTGTGKDRKRVVTYNDNTTETFDDPEIVTDGDGADGDGTGGKGFTQKDIDDAVAAALAKANQTTADRDKKANALASLTARFSQYGLQSLIPKIKELVINGSTEATIALELAETEEYKKRFKANADRLKKGLSVLDPGTYIGMEDSYRQALRAYGLKQFDTDDYVSQFIANDISANELSNRIVTAVQRVQNADPAITKQLKDFYNIGQNDLVAYVLDPNQQFQKIERQVQAAEIGVAAARQGITAGVQVAEQLAAQGVTQAEAQKGYATIADILPDAKKLSDIYGTTLEGYDLGQAEQEVFNQLASAQRRRQKLTQREIAAFGGSSGTNKTSLTTSSVGQF